MWLGSGMAVAMAQASGYGSSLGTSICHGGGPKNPKKKRKEMLYRMKGTDMYPKARSFGILRRGI